MAERAIRQISVRKKPKQSRSTDLVAAILEAAVQVLMEEGASRFTTARVAEKAGVSVGSLYQYFPNKAAILFRLQADEWRRTTAMLRNILEDTKRPALERLRVLVHAFIRSECEEAPIRVALGDAAPLYRDAPEASEARAAGDQVMLKFVQEVLPRIADNTCELVAELIATTFSTVGKEFSGTARTDAEIGAYADAMADMFSAWLEQISSCHGSKASLIN
ncbi:transcriptional regulator [Acetobacter aceti NRIC 0242]|uniref:TetR family transcriptional regulator n=1 Tax=Acetobacter aceti NBRC 14818 TaxID=887700 RepID=A0AB33II18_ACEAC|nr:TetR family transcriptional regulator [Acetobacter aceti]TCS31423.1 TetR family transcriptional regulator [Acetobacter aceti NBRC 14818]BCK76802.1 TetR family transcriptional regulator [Acetobacter aceti NBRC 14818]GAN56905.1 transcriptional regulator TetR [Acetobacter aceti NBRC 14818]GBO81741.1 transcriptional regulator [Acetobacter aceti NRIC 0242]